MTHSGFYCSMSFRPKPLGLVAEAARLDIIGDNYTINASIITYDACKPHTEHMARISVEV